MSANPFGNYLFPDIPSYQSGGGNAANALQSLYAALANQNWMQKDEMANAVKRQQQAQKYAQSLVKQQTALQNQANRQIAARQKAAEGMFSGMMNKYQSDPLFGLMRSSVSSWLQNPGLSNATMRRLQAQTQARAAADLAGSRNAIGSSAARLGLRGAQVEDARQAAASRSASALNRSLLDIDMQNEQMKQQGRAQALGAGGSLMGQYYGGLGNMGSAYARLLTSYNPQVAPLNVYDAMQQVYANPSYGRQSSAYNPYAALFG